MFNLTNLHPMIVHFPIALIIFGFIADILGLITKKEYFHKAGFYMMIIGTAGVFAAYFSGEAAEEFVKETNSLEALMESHESAAIMTLWIMVFVTIVRIGSLFIRKYSSGLKIISIIVFAAGVISVGRTGYYGGEMVYKHAAGVELTAGTKINQGNEKPYNGNVNKPDSDDED